MTGRRGEAIDLSAWVALEVGIARDLARRPPRVDLLPVPAPTERGGLVLLAAHTVFPEASVRSLPRVAREEVASGLRGPLRHAFADYVVASSTTAAPQSQSDEQLVEMRTQLFGALGGGSDIEAALHIVCRVHLARAARGTVPIAVGVACLTWYGAYVGPESPSSAVFLHADHLVDQWRCQPIDRADIELAMGDFVVETVGDAPGDLLNITV